MFLFASANGIIHNFPSKIIDEEVCMCPAFTETEHTVFATFMADYELKFGLWMNRAENTKWKADFSVAGSGNIAFPYFKIGPWSKFSTATESDSERIANLVAKQGCFFTITSAKMEEWHTPSCCFYPNDGDPQKTIID